ncbi:hypothetical protein ES288_D11G275600v1 [Gossypium darwinii]|uniref:Uncharacterized protein n=1 Tax=Gossypium darwinii TaxID=34276 RepID=A0A5D2AQ60_GOSDA|nr:hypothetical protein ES288_D11G275600v1 [Gossypium darwinii]
MLTFHCQNMGCSVKRTVDKLGVPFHNQPSKALQFCEDQRSFTSSCFHHECVIHTFHQISNCFYNFPSMISG